ncbi:MAG: hypothetical protein ABIE43_02685 [Patescibacteria group bacterium]
MPMNFKKFSPNIIGLLQSIGVAIYCSLISGLFWLMHKVTPEPPAFLGAIAILSSLVFSATVTGLLVFGYPAYLALNNKIKEALLVLAYTLLYSLLIIILFFFLVLI